MKLFILILCLLSFAPPAAAADSSVDMGKTEIKEMGRLNGQALACSHIEAVAKIKSLMIKLTPKSREYGEVFEAATNDGYLAQAKSGKATCPDATALSGQIDEAAKRMQAALTFNASESTKP